MTENGGAGGGSGLGPIGGVEVRAFLDGKAFEGWLEENFGRQEGIWVKVTKKKSGIPSVIDDELVDIGLCFGWISGQRRSLDGDHYLQRYVPRRPRSLWSQVNVDKVAVLLTQGRMREPGMAEVRRAQEDGRWTKAYESQKNAVAPPDLAAELDADPETKKAFDALDRTTRYQMILPLLQALTPKAREVRRERVLRALRSPGGS